MRFSHWDGMAAGRGVGWKPSLFQYFILLSCLRKIPWSCYPRKGEAGWGPDFQHLRKKVAKNPVWRGTGVVGGQTVREPRLQASGIWLCYLHQIMIIKHKFKDKITKSFKIKTTEFEIASAEIWVWGPRPQEASGAHTRDWRTAASQIFLNEAACHGGN